MVQYSVRRLQWAFKVNSVKKSVICSLVCWLIRAAPLPGQPAVQLLSTDAAELHAELNRLEIKFGEPLGFFPGIKAYSRQGMTEYALRLDSADQTLSASDRATLRQIFDDNNEWLSEQQELVPENLSIAQQSQNSRHYRTSQKSFFQYFYQTPANLLEVNHRSFYLRANPLADIRLGSIAEEDDPYFVFRRGVEFRGAIDDKIFFYSNFFETQARYPEYVRDFIRQYQALPGEGLIKPYSNSLLGFDDGRDFLNSESYFGVNLGQRHSFQINYGRNFLGNGHRSLLLSDFSNNYFHLKFNWRFGNFYYQNIFAELQFRDNAGSGDLLLTKKYLTAHYLGVKIGAKFDLALFEATVFNDLDVFRVQYLNPIILFRTLQKIGGNENNVLLGLDAKYNVVKSGQIYGQLLLNNITGNTLFDGSGSWDNRFGYQLGLKYIDVLGIDRLDLQVERNVVRPYTYMNEDAGSNYSHYRQPLAHPLGANFRETLFILRYRPADRLNFKARMIFMESGLDDRESNWGGNWLLSYETREMDQGNEIGQGINTRTSFLGLEASYTLAHNVFIDLYYLRRRADSEVNADDLNTSILGLGFRANIYRRVMDF